jgi:hypothetical protein
VIQRVVRSASEFAEISPALVREGQTVLVEASFDEYLLTLDITYPGRPLEIARTLPTEDELLEDENAVVRLGSILMARSADRISISGMGEHNRIFFEYEH